MEPIPAGGRNAPWTSRHSITDFIDFRFSTHAVHTSFLNIHEHRVTELRQSDGSAITWSHSPCTVRSFFILGPTRTWTRHPRHWANSHPQWMHECIRVFMVYKITYQDFDVTSVKEERARVNQVWYIMTSLSYKAWEINFAPCFHFMALQVQRMPLIFICSWNVFSAAET